MCVRHPNYIYIYINICWAPLANVATCDRERENLTFQKWQACVEWRPAREKRVFKVRPIMDLKEYMYILQRKQMILKNFLTS